MSDLVAAVRNSDHTILVGRLTLVLAVVNANEQPVAFGVAILALAGAFLRPGVLRRPWLWLGLAAVLGAVQFSEWYRIDDHVAVTTYWMLALGLSRFAVDTRQVLAVGARSLIACVFALAFAWKLLSSQFVSTDFFRYQLVADDRFALVSEHLGGTSEQDLASDRRSVAVAVAWSDEGETIELSEGPRQAAVAAVFTAWGLVIEGLVALAHTVPLRGRWKALRLITLFAFAYTTYAVVPVAGFGALLMTLALAMHDTRRTRVPIVASFVLLLAWGAVFPALV